jgi:hypothetical protein
MMIFVVVIVILPSNPAQIVNIEPKSGQIILDGFLNVVTIIRPCPLPSRRHI